MKVTKIDFTTEVLEIPDGQRERRFVTLDPLRCATLDGDDMRSPGTRTDEIYFVEIIVTPNGEKKRYLIKAGEKYIAEDMLSVSNSRLNQFINSQVEELYMRMKRRYEASIKADIKALPWWKRLFNKF